MRACDVVVIGGGIVGLATARELALRHRLSVLVAEREARLAAHQTGHNSGVVHSGLYYPPASHKATLCVEGRSALDAFAAERGIPHRRCGKLVVALDEAELPRLAELERRGRANGLVGLERLDAVGIREREPHAAGLAGLWVPQTGIIDYGAVCAALAADLAGAGGEIRLGAAFAGLDADGGDFVVRLGGERVATRLVVGCAGLESDRVARRCRLAPEVRIVPFRGEYRVLVAARRELVRGLIYPVPDPDLPFLGVHLTRRVDGTVEAGPNAVLAWRRDGYAPGAFGLRDAASMLSFPGFWRMARRQAAVARREYRRAWSGARFADALRRLVPELREADLAPGGCGIRAQAVDRRGRLVDDFVFAEDARQLHVLNAPSPAATAALAIARRLGERAAAKLAHEA
ncbi:MAG TPA: L-2-hydroxyglutarate oxidase [Thermoanaerobaculia bacterium]